MDWGQLWKITSSPDNVPIVGLLFLMPFYTWYGLRQSFANDRLIEQLEKDPEMAKTHHRKTQPWKPGWAQELHVWPFLLRIEFLAAIIVTVILMVWSITLNAPLEEPSNPTLTMNPSKAPWYFLGLQEMLVYFDPWMAGVVLPTMIIVGLLALPYIDFNQKGNGYYTFAQRKFERRHSRELAPKAEHVYGFVPPAVEDGVTFAKAILEGRWHGRGRDKCWVHARHHAETVPPSRWPSAAIFRGSGESAYKIVRVPAISVATSDFCRNEQ